MRYQSGSCATPGLVMRALIFFVGFFLLASLGCGPRVKPVTLDFPAEHRVYVAPAELEPGAGKSIGIEALGSGRYRYDEKDLAVFQQMLDETNPMPGAPEDSVRIHIVVRRYLVAYHESEAAGIACVAWALTNPQNQLVFDETIYAAAYTDWKGVNGVKHPMNQGLTKRIHSAAQAVASGLSPGAPPTSVYEDYDSAAAAVPDALGPVFVISFQRGGVQRGVEYTGETGEEFARCDDSIDWYHRLGIRRPEVEAPSDRPSDTITEPPKQSPVP